MAGVETKNTISNGHCNCTLNSAKIKKYIKNIPSLQGNKM